MKYELPEGVSRQMVYGEETPVARAGSSITAYRVEYRGTDLGRIHLRNGRWQWLSVRSRRSRPPGWASCGWASTLNEATDALLRAELGEDELVQGGPRA